MAGIYIHIPFCKQKCAYCDFYKTTQLSLKERFIDSLIKELKYRKDIIKNEPVKTIYFGGGTPSVLEVNEISSVIQEIGENYNIGSGVEITLEANPDDLHEVYLENLSKSPVNRLSIGIQSFSEDNLKLMNRRHNASQAIKCVYDAFNIGFDNISIDLIYGVPGLSIESWEENLHKAFSLPVCHISAYHLTYHKETRFYNLLKQGVINEINEEESVAQFDLLISLAAKNNFEHYEISNFAKNAIYSKHNSAYWFGEKYLGFGPSAHSYYGNTRQWNIENIEKYLSLISKGKFIYGSEKLSETDKYNDYIITRLRTKWGINLNEVTEKFGLQKCGFLKSNIETYILNGFVVKHGSNLVLTRKGMFISDKIMEDIIYLFL